MFALEKRTPWPGPMSSYVAGNRIKSSHSRQRWRNCAVPWLSSKGFHVRGDDAALCCTLQGHGSRLRWGLLADGPLWILQVRSQQEATRRCSCLLNCSWQHPICFSRFVSNEYWGGNKYTHFTLKTLIKTAETECNTIYNNDHSCISTWIMKDFLKLAFFSPPLLSRFPGVCFY